MNYDTATNDQLEVRVGELLGMGSISVLNAPRYCTDWNATMPLAIEHKISVRWLDGVNCWVSDQVFDNQGGVYSSFSSYQLETGGEILEQTPLRTIVISLIKVLEAKNDSGQK